MNASVVEVIRITSICSVLIPLITYVLKWKNLPRANHIAGAVIVASAIIEFFVTLASRESHSTTILYNSYFVIVFLLLSAYYYEVVFKFKNRGYFLLGVATYLLCLITTAFRSDFTTYQGEMWSATGFILVFFGILYNHYQVEKPPLFDKNLYSGLIFNGAIMLYFSFNFFLFIIANYVLTTLSPDESRMTWAFHNVNNIIKNIAFAFGLYFSERRRVNLSDEEVERIQWRHLQS